MTPVSMRRRAISPRRPTRRPAARLPASRRGRVRARVLGPKFDRAGRLRYPCEPAKASVLGFEDWISSGEVAEWSKALAWKVSNILKGVRGFESLPLRQPQPQCSMAARVCIFATTGHEPRQARKGAAVGL